MKPHAVGQKYKKQLMRADPGKYVRRHVDRWHVGKEPEGRLPPDPQSMTGQKVERHRKSVDERIDEIYQMTVEAGRHCMYDDEGKLLPRGSCDVHGFAKCMAEARAATALMGKPGSTEKDESESDGYIEAVRATARHDWKEARPVQVEATKPEAEDDSELVDA